MSNTSDLVIEIDKNKNLFLAKISASLFDNKKIVKEECPSSIEILSKLDYYNLTITKSNRNYSINISTINILNYDLLIKSQCLKLILISSSSFVRDNNINNIKITSFNINNSTNDSANESYIRNMNGKKINNILCNLLLILFSIINVKYIHIFKTLINKNNLLIYAFSIEIFCINFYQHFDYFLSSFTYNWNNIDSKESLIIKIFYLSGCTSALISVVSDSYFLNFLFDKLIEAINSLLPYFRFLPIFIIDLLKMNKCVDYNICEYFMWYFQILNNIFYNNKYTYPLFYIIFFTIDKLIFKFLANGEQKDYSNLSIFKPLISISLSIIIIFMQAFYGPRFMLSSKYQEKNQRYYLSKKELLKEKPKSKYENCTICLIPLLNKNKINKKNNNIDIKEEKKVLNKIKEIYELNLSQEDIIIYKEFIKRILTKGILDFYEYDFRLLKKYMLIPCGHFFHSNCLENWIEIENKCPLCRQSIPIP